MSFCLVVERASFYDGISFHLNPQRSGRLAYHERAMQLDFIVVGHVIVSDFLLSSVLCSYLTLELANQ